LLEGFSGQETISSLFRFHLDLIAENQYTIAFEDLLGQKVSVELQLPGGDSRYFHGILSSFSQGGRNLRFTRYSAELVPQFWLLTRQVRSRIFQQMTVPDILKAVLANLDVSWEIQGTFQPRDYCVQYRESDFQFASRLMEEEGIYYFFMHTADSDEMVVANTPQSHLEIPDPSRLIYEEIEGGTRGEELFIAGKSRKSCAQANIRSGTIASNSPASISKPKRPSSRPCRQARSCTSSRLAATTHSRSMIIPGLMRSALMVLVPAAESNRTSCKKSLTTMRAPWPSACNRRRCPAC